MRIALLGATDPCAREYLRAVSAIPDVIEFIGLVESATAVGEPLAREFGVPWYAATDDLPLDRLDAAIVGGGIDERPALIEQASGWARHVLSAMPPGSTRAGAEAAVGHCAGLGVSLHPAWPWRFLPVIQSVRALVEDGSLGQPLSFNLQHRSRGVTHSNGRGATRRAMLQHMTHTIDLVRWLSAADVIEVYAEVGRGALLPGGVEADAAILSVALANGAYATLDVSLSLPPTFPVAEDLQLETIGTGGWVRADACRQHIQVHTVEAAHWSDWGSRPVEGLLKAFLDAVRHDRPATAEDALRVQALALSAL
jgi:predicted dehydrogenase